MKKKVICLFTFLFLTMIICGCFAAEDDRQLYTKNNQASTAEVLDPIDKAERNCISKTADTYEMNVCSQRAQQSWEKDIQETLAELKKFLNTEDYKKLQSSQTSWENYKNKNYNLIDSVVSYKHGTMYLNVREGWKTEIVKQRALILREYLNTLKED